MPGDCVSGLLVIWEDDVDNSRRPTVNRSVQLRHATSLSLGWSFTHSRVRVRAHAAKAVAVFQGRMWSVFSFPILLQARCGFQFVIRGCKAAFLVVVLSPASIHTVLQQAK